MSDAIVIIDMQEALVGEIGAAGKRAAVVETFNNVTGRLAALRDRARQQGIPVFIVQNDSPAGDRLEPGTAGWQVVEALRAKGDDVAVRKESCDSFHETTLSEHLRGLGVTRLVMGGYATQYCVDTSVRSAISHGFNVVLVADGHCSSDSPTLQQAEIIAHHTETLDGFHSGPHAVIIAEAAAVEFERSV